MSENEQVELDITESAGMQLRAAREAEGMSEREMADRLNWMPGYVAVIESDNYEGLRNPAFARGYVKVYGRLLGLNEDKLLSAFDEFQATNGAVNIPKRDVRKPLSLHKTGFGVVTGLSLLALVVALLWWQNASAGDLSGVTSQMTLQGKW